MNQREVDMTVISKFNEGKARKKAKVEEELRDAITALKKPNRGLVTSDYFRTADKLVLAPGNQRKARHCFFSHIDLADLAQRRRYQLTENLNWLYKLVLPQQKIGQAR